jgi:hypothetical protein
VISSEFMMMSNDILDMSRGLLEVMLDGKNRICEE